LDTASGDPVGLDHLVLNSAVRESAVGGGEACERFAAALVDAG